MAKSIVERLKRFSDKLKSGEPIHGTRVSIEQTSDGPLTTSRAVVLKSVRPHPDWVTCPACQCDMAEVLSEHPDPDQIKHLAMGYCSAECFNRSE
jgi:hypothetical protein